MNYAIPAINFAFANMSLEAFIEWQEIYIGSLEAKNISPDYVIEALDHIAFLLF